MRTAHPDEYNGELERKYEKPGRLTRITGEDQIRMSELEIQYEGRWVRKYLEEQFPHFTRDQIRRTRAEPQYQELLERLREDRERTPPGSPVPGTSNTESFVNHSSGTESSPERRSVEGISEHRSNPERTASQGGDVSASLTLNVLDADAEEFVPMGNRAALATYLDEYFRTHDTWSDPEREIYRNSQLDNAEERREGVRLLLDEYITTDILSVSTGKRRSKNANSKAKTAPVINNRDHERALNYRLAQHRYRTDRSSLAQAIIDGKPLWGVDASPNIKAVEKEYRAIFSSISPRDDEPISDQKDPALIGYAITEAEILGALQAMKSQAAGPDFLKIKELRRVPVRKLVLVFNTMLQFGVTPEVLKSCRTTLIPKGGDPLEVGNWRPITISSVLVRLFHRVLGKRLSSLDYHENQRGFRQVDGVLLNNLTLQTIIKQRRSGLRPYNIISIDLRKAFDTVSHRSIERAMTRFGVDDTFKRYVMDTYRNSRTVITVGGKSTKNINMNRGVKQGDPLSPYLFNMVVDELICKLEEDIQGLPVVDGRKVSVLGYADDLILLSDSFNDGNKQLRTAVGFFERRGMSINAGKSAAITVNVDRGNKHSYCVTHSLFSVGNDRIRQLKPSEMFKYLGQRYNALGQTKVAFQDLQTQLDRISKSGLGPAQKLNLVKTYLLPRYIDKLQSPTISLKALKGFDRTIRIAVRKFLRLNRTCADAYIHAPTREGGLGVMTMVMHVPAILRRRLTKLMISATQTTADILSLPYMSRFWEKLVKWTSNNGGSSASIARELSAKLEIGYSGNGLAQGSCHPESSAWIHNPPPYWSGRDYVKAIQLRGNLLPTKGIPSNPPQERMCRTGCGRSESLSHVLQKCSKAHWQRCRRHDQLVTSLRKSCERKGWICQVEPRIRLGDGSLRIPDLVACLGDRVIVAEVTVTWEGPDPMNMAASNKTAIYTTPQFLQAMQAEYPGKIISMAPLVVGARGTWCRANSKIQGLLNLSRLDIRNLITKAILGSLCIHSWFMKNA